MTITRRDGFPCDHPGCLSHKTHPCEGCGRVGGIAASNEYVQAAIKEIREVKYLYADQIKDLVEVILFRLSLEESERPKVEASVIKAASIVFSD